MTTSLVWLQVLVIHAATRQLARVRHRADDGQTTAEYALVILGAAAIALLVLGWATKTDQISKLMDFVMKEIVGRAG